MEILNHEICLVELLLGGKLKGLVHRDPRDGFEHGDEQFFDANIVVFATAMILGAVEPENSNIAAQLRSF